MFNTRAPGAILALFFSAGLTIAAAAETTTASVTKQKFSLPIDRAAVAQEWRSRDFDCTPHTAGQGWASRMHTHDSDEVLAVIEGRVGLVYGDQRLAADPGDEMYLPAETLHRLDNLHEGTVVFLYGLKSSGVTIRRTDKCSP